jgi:TonB family protein
MATWQQWEGRVISGRFTLWQYLGGSEQSAVYLTEINGSKAAIKLIPADAAYAQAQVSQWELARKLSHPHLVRILETGRHADDQQDVFFAVMEYADENLADIVPGRALRTVEAHQMLVPTLDALNYLHGQGIVHGNIKPANIMAVGDELKLSSDGVRRVGKSPGSVGIGNEYDAPEMAGGAISPSADIWSLGMTLVEALTNHLPAWDREDKKDPKLPEYVPQPFDDIAKHCVNRDPTRRWSATEIRKRLNRPPVAAKEDVARQEISAAAEVQESPAPAAQTTVPSPQARETFVTRPGTTGKRRGFRGAVAVIITLVVSAAGVRLFHHRSETPQPASTTSKQQSAASPQPMKNASLPASRVNAVGLDHGAVTHEVLPDVSRKARESITGTIRVKVKVAVDTSGTVSHATLVSHRPSGYFANQAFQAARKWTFAVPTFDGRATPSEWSLRFDFKRNGTTAVSQRTSPGT